jgi:uncharacterized protein (DUF1501 family)
MTSSPFKVMRTSRRRIVAAGGALFASAYLPKISNAASTRDPRFVTIILRGALDGLSAVAPLGDPDYANLHGSIALPKSGDNAALPLDGFFALNPSMKSFANMYAEKQAAVIHAVATGYRDRSHFDGQDVLESGYPGTGRTDSGWLNRALETLPKGSKVRAGLAVGAATPLILRGSAPVTGWAPTQLAHASDDMAMRLLDLYKSRDPALANALAQGLSVEAIVSRELGERRGPSGNFIDNMRQIARGAAKLMAADDGPRISALSFDGWDTHVAEGGATGRLAQLLAGLDSAFEEFQVTLGAAWKDTVIVAVTEFGRTVRINGTTGTDHGTGTVAFLAGGALDGGRVIADWPGLKENQLYEKRDLRPTVDLRSVLKGILADHLGISVSALAEKVFPDTNVLPAMKNLIS